MLTRRCRLLCELVILTLCAFCADAQEPEVSPNGHASIWFPTAEGPNNTLLSINVIDALLFSYQSQWQNVNASMWCLTDNSTGTYTGRPLNNPCETTSTIQGPFHHFILTQTIVASTGNYLIQDLNKDIDTAEFPLPCHFALVDAYDESDTFAGGTYLMVSTRGAAVTHSYAVSTTSAGSSIPSTTGTSVSSPVSSTASSPATGSSATAASSATVLGSDHDTDDASSKGLADGAIAGIVVGSVAGTLALVGLLAFWIRGRRKASGWARKGPPPPLEETKIHEADHQWHGTELSGSLPHQTAPQAELPIGMAKEKDAFAPSIAHELPSRP